MLAHAQPILTSTVTEIAAVIVFGPQGCGKTRNGKDLADFFGKPQIIDDWKLGDHLPPDALCLTSDARVHGLEQFQMPGLPPSMVVEYSDIAHQLGLVDTTAADYFSQRSAA